MTQASSSGSGVLITQSPQPQSSSNHSWGPAYDLYITPEQAQELEKYLYGKQEPTILPVPPQPTSSEVFEAALWDSDSHEVLVADQELQDLIDDIEELRRMHDPFKCEGLTRYISCSRCSADHQDQFYGLKLKKRLDAWTVLLRQEKADNDDDFDPTDYD